MKKEVLLVYDSMMLGGSTTSLIALLEALPKDKYNIDLLLYLNEGECLNQIPQGINLLPPAFNATRSLSTFKKIIVSVVNGQLFRYFSIIKRNNIKRPKEKRSVLAQLSVEAQVALSRTIEKEYDVAIGFMEFWSDAFVASKKVCAAKKIAWVHVDYPNSGLLAEIDGEIWPRFQNVVLVSEECKKSFVKTFPALRERCVTVNNVCAQKMVRARAQEKADVGISSDKSKINIVTVCRLSFQHKGLDRALTAISRIQKESDKTPFCWYVIGDGPDGPAMRERIEKEGLGACIVLVGALENPIATEKEFDAFFLPSRYEGKPMAVTEALMLGLPCFVTEYASAKEQITNGRDGFVFDNSDEGTYNALRYIIGHKEEIGRMHADILKNDYSDFSGVGSVINLIDEGW